MFFVLVILMDDVSIALIWTAILSAVFGLSFNLDVTIETIDKEIEERLDEPPANEVDTETLIVPPDNVTPQDVPKEYISDQIRNEEKVQWNGEQVCRDNGECFTPKFRQHDNGTLYACEIDGLQCYGVK